MAVSKRLRYEVFRRDNHACRYCGAAAPEAKLVIDAVVPEALGGSHSDPSNLVTACEACNNGKGASSPDAPLVEDVSADALRWGRAMQEAAEVMLAEYGAQTELQEQFLSRWQQWHTGSKYHPRDIPLPSGWQKSVDGFLAAGLPMEVLLGCIETAMAKSHVQPSETFRYMCGIAWKKVGELREIAASLVDTVDAPQQKPWCGKCDRGTRLVGYGRDDEPPVRRCPDCHPFYSVT